MAIRPSRSRLFRLPGLSTGAILIETNLSAFGTGTVSVNVTSLSNSALTASRTATVSAALITTNTQLVATPNPLTTGRTVTFTATVAPSSGNATPTGTVTFFIDGIAQSPVDLIVTNGQAQASFSTSTLTQGTHTITASYSGGDPFVSSLSNPVDEKVEAPGPAPSSDGPQIKQLQRFGYHMMPTSIVLTFDQALEQATAENTHNYRITGPRGRAIRIASAMYDPKTETVTLRPSERINIHFKYELTVKGAKAGGLTDTQGLLLDGAENGKPGSNYRAALTGKRLVVPTHAATKSEKSKTSTRAMHPKPKTAHSVLHGAGTVRQTKVVSPLIRTDHTRGVEIVWQSLDNTLQKAFETRKGRAYPRRGQVPA